jgi:hypothetical protein
MVEDDACRAAGEDDRALREKRGFGDRVGDEDHGHAPAMPKLIELFVQLVARQLVESGERFVK